MTKNFRMRFLHRAAFITIIASILLVAGPIKVEAAGKPLSCNISPDAGTATVGVATRFSGMTVGGKGAKTYNWDFSDGAGVPAVSTDNNVDVTYSTAGGPFDVLLDVTDRQAGRYCKLQHHRDSHRRWWRYATICR